MDVKEPIGVLGLTKTPGVFVVGAKKGFGIIDLRALKSGDVAEIEYKKIVHTSEEDLKKLRFNDGYVDAQGRFFAGSMVE